MKKIRVITLLCLFFSCTDNSDVSNKNDWNSIEHLQKLCNELMMEIDSSAWVNVSSKSNSDTLLFSFGNISKISDSPEFAELFRDYVLAKIYLLNNQAIPEILLIDVGFVRGIKYSYQGKLMNHQLKRLQDEEFVDYLKFLLTNVHPKESAYFDITIPVLKEFYIYYDYTGNLLNLLIEFYFVEENQNVKTWFFVFYGNCDFKQPDFECDKNTLDEILIKKGFVPEEWTLNRINNLYMDTYDIDTIKTVENEIYFMR